MKVQFHTASGSEYLFDSDSNVLTRQHPHNNIVRATTEGAPPFEGPTWTVSMALILAPQMAIFQVAGRTDPLVTTGLVDLEVIQ